MGALCRLAFPQFQWRTPHLLPPQGPARNTTGLLLLHVCFTDVMDSFPAQPKKKKKKKKKPTGLHFVQMTADKAMMSMADPLVDVRIATWLVMPDAIEVTDSPTRVSMRKGDNPWNLEGLLNLRAGKEAVTSSVSVLRKVSGRSTLCVGILQQHTKLQSRSGVL